MNKLVIFITLIIAQYVNATESDDFGSWLQVVKQEAITQGISENAIEVTIQHAQYLPSVIKLDRSQPEFVSPFMVYLDHRVTASNIQKGQVKLASHTALLNQLEVTYSVPKQVLLAFWGLETNYGNNKGNYGLASSLATLAFEGRRATFFKNELFDLMRIIDAKHQSVLQLRGSWAGASGHMQFMPSTFVKYAVDGDDDGQINIWNSLPDAFASAANYLSKVGWVKDEPIAMQVSLPKNFNYQLAQLGERHDVNYWQKMGVKSAKPIGNLNNAAIVLPQGWQGPAFMVFSNFDVVMHWNRSVNYALSVSLLADEIIQEKSFSYAETAHPQPLSFNQIWAIQGKLNNLGYACGEPDGYPGLKTQEAIRAFQITKGMPADGFASVTLYQALLNY
jgi:membrane-bound lytic murein transglycosylase B